MSAKKFHEPLFRISERPAISRGRAMAIRLGACVCALAAGAVLIALLGYNPFSVYGDMLMGAVGTGTVLKETVKNAVPLLMAALSVALSFRMKFWNIGAEGQILIGGIAASYFALFSVGVLPSAVLLIVMMVAAAVSGGVWGAIPACFKAKWNTNETLFTLMMNYIALGFVKYLQHGPWKKESGTGFPQIALFDKAARLPKLFGVHIGWIIAIALVIIVYVYIKYTKHGYEAVVVGQGRNTAKYAGMNVSKILIRTMFFSGLVAGIVGFTQVAGANYTLSPDTTAGGIGFTAITVAWLSQLKPFVMIAVAFFIAVLEKGAGNIQTVYGIPASAADVLIGIILFFMLGCEFFIRYNVVLRRRRKVITDGHDS